MSDSPQLTRPSSRASTVAAPISDANTAAPPAYEQAVATSEQNSKTWPSYLRSQVPWPDPDDAQGWAAARKAAIPFTMLVLRIVASVAVLLARVAGLALSHLLSFIHSTLTKLDTTNYPPSRADSVQQSSSADESDVTATAESTAYRSRRHRVRDANKVDESASLQHLLRSSRPLDMHIHHHHHHHAFGLGGHRQNSLGLSLDGDSWDNDEASDSDSGSSIPPSDRNQLDSDDSTVMAFPGTDEYEEPQDAFARKLARMALRAQAELDMRLARGELSPEDGEMSPHDDGEAEFGEASGPDTEDNSGGATPIASITSTDPTTPLATRPLQIPLLRRGESVQAPGEPLRFTSPFDPSTASNYTMPMDQLLTSFTAPITDRRSSAPASILQRSQSSSNTSDTYALGTATPSEADSVPMSESQSSSQGSSKRKVRLTEPDWQPYVETHARARARVQLNALLQAARTTQQNAPSGRRTSVRSFSSNAQVEDRQNSLRSDLRAQALNVHAMHTDQHAALHARAHHAAQKSNVLDEDLQQSPVPIQGKGLVESPMDRSYSLSTNGSFASLGNSSVSTAMSSMSPPTEPDVAPEYWFERFFPGRAASGDSWDWRKPKHRHRRHRRHRSKHQLPDPSTDEEDGLMGPGVSDAVLERVAQMLFEEEPSGSNSSRHSQHGSGGRRSIVSQANAAAAIMSAKGAGLPRARVASAPTVTQQDESDTSSEIENLRTPSTSCRHSQHRRHHRHHHGHRARVH